MENALAFYILGRMWKHLLDGPFDDADRAAQSIIENIKDEIVWAPRQNQQLLALALSIRTWDSWKEVPETTPTGENRHILAPSL